MPFPPSVDSLQKLVTIVEEEPFALGTFLTKLVEIKDDCSSSTISVITRSECDKLM